MSITTDLSGRVAIVLGAASDMGLASARALAASGARVLLADLDLAGLESAVEAIQRSGGTARAQQVDVTRSEQVESGVQGVVADWGRLDVLANLAGVIHDAPVVELEEAEMDRVWSVNTKGVTFGCQSAARVMCEQGSGSIINMASSGAFTPSPNLAAYAMSKAAVVALTRVLAAEIGPSGVRVNAIAPGYVEGGMTHRHFRNEDGTLDEEGLAKNRERMRRRNALRILGEPEDVANALLFLASDASRYMTGQVLHANGGGYIP